MSLTVRVLIGLVAGLLAGLAISASGAEPLLAAARAVEPIGSLWVNAIRMTVIPLVVSLLITGIASATDPRALGRLGARAILLFLVVLFAAALWAALATPPLLTILRIDPATAESLRASAGGTAGAAADVGLPGFAQWLIDLIPTNPVRAAADGAMLPLIVFAMALAIAATRLPVEQRQTLVSFFDALGAAMLVLVRWVLALAPVGVFALALPLAARLGLAAAGALAYYIALVSFLLVIFMGVALYPAAVVLGRVPLRRFAQASAPAQAVAFSSRSSLAALPAMIEGVETRLNAPPEIPSFFLPFSASVFRVGGAIQQTAGVIFLAQLYGAAIEPTQFLTIIVTAVLTSFTVPGIPGGSILVMLPVLLAAGLPAEGIGLLLAVDTIPDMFRTATNVTGHMTAAAVLAREARRRG